MERAVDFNRDRQMRCGQCGDEWTVDPAWVERWNEGREACPACGTTSEADTAAHFTAHADDQALDDGVATQLAWYHTSTHLDWPPTIDLPPSLTNDMRREFGDDAADQWAHLQANKALHIGTYESAIHNMLRRIRDQDDQGNQFYLYRVHLKPEVVMLPGWIPDPSNWLGDVDLDKILPPEAEAVRYVNFHEDAGALSVAIRPAAIGASQCLAIPLAVGDDEPWILETVAQLSNDPPDQQLTPELSNLSHYLLGESPRSKTAADAVKVLANWPPTHLRYLFESVTRWRAESDPNEWARKTLALAGLIENSGRVLAELDARATREH